MRLRVCARALISFHHEAGQRVGARIPFIMSLPRAYSDFPCERAPFLTGVSVRAIRLGFAWASLLCLFNQACAFLLQFLCECGIGLPGCDSASSRVRTCF